MIHAFTIITKKSDCFRLLLKMLPLMKIISPSWCLVMLTKCFSLFSLLLFSSRELMLAASILGTISRVIIMDSHTSIAQSETFLILRKLSHTPIEHKSISVVCYTHNDTEKKARINVIFLFYFI